MSGALLSFQQNNVSSRYAAIALVGLSILPTVYRFANNTIGTKYATPAGFSDPTRAVDWLNLPNSNTTDIAVASENSPYVAVWAWDYTSGFGTKYSNPGIPPANQGRDVAFFGPTDNGTTNIAVAHLTSPYVSAYPWTTGVGFGTKFADPVALPGTGASSTNGVSFAGKDNAGIAVASSLPPYLYFYAWSNTGLGWGTNTPFAGTYSGFVANAVQFDGSAAGSSNIAVAHQLSPYVSVYPYSQSGGTVTIGSKYADPATLPTGDANDVAWFQETHIAVAHQSAPYVSVYPWAAGFGTKMNDPSTLPTGMGRSVDFTNNVAPGSFSCAVGHDTSPYVSVYPFNQITGLGTKSADPATLPTGSVYGVKFSPYS